MFEQPADVAEYRSYGKNLREWMASLDRAVADEDRDSAVEAVIAIGSYGAAAAIRVLVSWGDGARGVLEDLEAMCHDDMQAPFLREEARPHLHLPSAACI